MILTNTDEFLNYIRIARLKYKDKDGLMVPDGPSNTYYHKIKSFDTKTKQAVIYVTVPLTNGKHEMCRVGFGLLKGGYSLVEAMVHLPEAVVVDKETNEVLETDEQFDELRKKIFKKEYHL